MLPQFQSAHGNYPQMIRRILEAAASAEGIEISVINFDVEHGEYPDSPDSCDGYVITGSKKSVYDDEPWIHELKTFVRKLDSRRIRLVGICFGHQLIAEALGGRTIGAEAGWGVGIHDYEVIETGWFMSPGTEHFSLVVSHKDQVVDLPEDATLLAGSAFCPNSLFTIGEHVLAVQGHPEFSRSYSADLMHWRKDILGPETYDKGIASLENPLSEKEVATWIIRFLWGAENV